MTINESIFMSLKVSEKSEVPVLFIGNPGSGKTTTIEYYAELTGRKLILLRGSQSSPEEILGYEVNSDEVDKNGNSLRTTSKLRPTWFMELKEAKEKGIKTLLFLDEITTAGEHVQSALLQVIFGRSIDNVNRLPEDCLVVAAGNYASNLSSGFNLIPPLMNRFCIINIVPKKSDLKLYLSKYQRARDPKSLLKTFSLSHEVSSNRPDDFNKIGEVIESRLHDFTIGLIDNKKYDPTVTDMSDIYQDNTDTILPGFVTFRTLNYYRDMIINMYSTYGLFGIESEVFRSITEGLVGIGLGRDKNKRVISNSLVEDYLQFSISVCKDLDKKRNTSINRLEKSIKGIIVELDTEGSESRIKVLSSEGLIALKKIFDSYENDNSINIDNPIDKKLLSDVSDIIVDSARHVLDGDLAHIQSLINTGVDSGLNIDSVNGDIKHYNDAIRAFKSLDAFVSNPVFKYSGDLISKIKSSDREIISTNGYKIQYVKQNIVKLMKVNLSELVKTETL